MYRIITRPSHDAALLHIITRSWKKEPSFPAYRNDEKKGLGSEAGRAEERDVGGNVGREEIKKKGIGREVRRGERMLREGHKMKEETKKKKEEKKKHLTLSPTSSPESHHLPPFPPTSHHRLIHKISSTQHPYLQGPVSAGASEGRRGVASSLLTWTPAPVGPPPTFPHPASFTQ